MRTWQRRCAVIGFVYCFLLIGCEGEQSALAPAGRGAERIAHLFWWMTAGGTLIWLIMIGLAAYAIWIRPETHDAKRSRRWIIGGGVVVPTVVLAILLSYGLAMLPELLARPPQGSLQIEVDGIQWWWRVRYPGRTPEDTVELANEIRLPVGEPVEFLLRSTDVVHSFWVPSLGGKVDMIPGRQTRLTLEPTKTGRFRGVCAEYCGTAHTQMTFYVVVMQKPEFEQWLAVQRRSAGEPVDALARRGQYLFGTNGCGACHSVRGTSADGTIGPDLTHVGSRVSLGAGILGNESDDFLRWISDTDGTKPGVHMPAFHMLSDAELQALAAYLEGLK